MNNKINPGTVNIGKIKLKIVKPLTIENTREKSKNKDNKQINENKLFFLYRFLNLKKYINK